MSEAPAYRDRLPPPEAGGEAVLAEFRPDRGAYVRHHLQWAAAGGVGAVAVLLALGRGHTIWAGVLGVLAALAFRGLWLYRDAMAERWLLTPTALLGPGERLARAEIAWARPVFGGVLVASRGGRRLWLRYLAEPARAAALIGGAP